jgi:hypothetical protein
MDRKEANAMCQHLIRHGSVILFHSHIGRCAVLHIRTKRGGFHTGHNQAAQGVGIGHMDWSQRKGGYKGPAYVIILNLD